MIKYGSYKHQVALIYQFFYKEEERLEFEIQDRDMYFRSGRRKRDEVDFLEDMSLQIQVNQLKHIKNSVYALIGVFAENPSQRED